ncbi:MAG: hypothetical protein DDT26_02386 [Dehalococcoidia bacterium]|nr:hypothetical protein [Chloroflexota bacterium]
MEDMVITPEARRLEEAAERHLVTAQSMVVRNAADYQSASEVLKAIKSRLKEVEDLRKGMTRPLDAAKAKIMAFFKPVTESLTNAETRTKKSMLVWQAEEEQKRLEEERRLQALARREQERLDRLAEERAQRWEDKGQLEKAEQIRDSVPVIPVPIVVREAPKAEGISTRTIWKFRIIDKEAIPHEYMIPNEKMLGDFARATKGTIAIPGIEFYAEEILASRGIA